MRINGKKSKFIIKLSIFVWKANGNSINELFTRIQKVDAKKLTCNSSGVS